MDFKQYTRCIEPDVFSGRYRYITVAAVLAGTPAALIAVAAGHPACLVIALTIMGLAGLVAYYHNWLYHRLLCLGGDRDCFGAIVSIERPHLALNSSTVTQSALLGLIGFTISFLDRDTDCSINLLLENTDYGPVEDGLTDAEIETAKRELQEDAEQSTPFGELVAPQPSVTAIGRKTPGHFTTDGEPNKDDGHTHKMAAVMHAEFEGDGNYKMLQASKVLLAVAIYALVACLFLPFPLDAILAVGILLFALLGLIFASLLGLSGGGSPSDVNAGELTDSTGVNADGQPAGADLVYVRGTWVYDTLHEGWNEIHPIKICTKMGKWDGNWPPPNTILRLRHGFEVARTEETIANQARPEYQWQIHPDLDGCDSDVIL